MYIVSQSSKLALSAKLTKPIKNTEPLPSRIGSEFPFKALAVGQSFYLKYDENISYKFSLVKERINRYNKLYAVYFMAIKHKDEPKRLEIARLF
jgi:hypothetical protein